MREKLWMEKFKGADLKDHHRRLRESRHLVDDSSPPKAARSARLARERERQAQFIDKDNKLMLNRLAKVIQEKNIDNDPFRLKAMSGAMAKNRLRNKLRKENDHMLNRLKNAEKTYSADKMRQDEAWRQKVLYRMCDQRLKQPTRSSKGRPSSSNAAVRPNSALQSDGPNQNISGRTRSKKAAWQGTAIALNEQDCMHLTSEIKPLRAASPVFLSKQNAASSYSLPSSPSNPSSPSHRNMSPSRDKMKRNRPKTASDVVHDRHAIRMPSTRSDVQLPSSVTSDTPSATRTREMKRLFKKPTGAYMSTKI